MDERGTAVTDKMRRYTTPLLIGEAPFVVGDDGLPVYVRLEKHWIDKKAPGDYTPGG